MHEEALLGMRLRVRSPVRAAQYAAPATAASAVRPHHIGVKKPLNTTKKGALAALRAGMRRIDLTCLIASPIMAGALLQVGCRAAVPCRHCLQQHLLKHVSYLPHETCCPTWQAAACSTAACARPSSASWPGMWPPGCRSACCWPMHSAARPC